MPDILTDPTFTIGASYLGAALSMGLGAIGAGASEGITAGKAIEGMARQPAEQGTLLKTMLIGQAVAETAGIFSLVVALIMIINPTTSASIIEAFARIGAGFAMGLSALGSGVGAGLVSASACEGIARQPETGGKMTISMLISQSLSQSPLIFGFIVAILLLFAISYPEDIPGIIRMSAAYMAAGICMGTGAVGPGLGSGLVGSKMSEGIGKNLAHQDVIFRTMIIGSAIAQSTSIYALVISLILIFLVK